jgi:hypothetical protein
LYVLFCNKRPLGNRNSNQARHHLEDNCNPEIPRIFALCGWKATLLLAVRRNGEWAIAKTEAGQSYSEFFTGSILPSSVDFGP